MAYGSQPMKVILISSDSELRKLCGDILSTFAALGWQLSTATPEGCPLDADFYIWDNPTSAELPHALDRPAKHLFLVNRSESGTFYQRLGSAEANILLKPVTRASLSAFLGMAVSAFQDRLCTTTSLRADRDEILQCLIQSNLKLQEYDQDRTNFLARAVHDFRAPLTATCGYCGLLLSEALGPVNEDQKEVLRRMQHSVKRLSRMASAMFELSVGRQVKRKPDLREADIRECIEQALHEVNPFADGKRIAITVDLDPPPAGLHIEPSQIEQVVINLLDNACKFTPRGGEIDIRGYAFFWERRSVLHSSVQESERRQRNSRLANAYRIDIRDSGPQIPWEHLDNIFEEYTSYGGGQDRSGGGLGLAICRMIVTLHEGRVWGEDTDQGPRFSFVIPLHSAGVGKTEVRDAEAAQISEVW
jgi:signal transduction histidine kinase